MQLDNGFLVSACNHLAMSNTCSVLRFALAFADTLYSEDLKAKLALTSTSWESFVGQFSAPNSFSNMKMALCLADVLPSPEQQQLDRTNSKLLG